MPVLAADSAAIARAAETLRAGGLVAFPTETVYGLGARLFDREAVTKVFRKKGRPPSHPLIAHVLAETDARSLAAEWPELASRLARAFWPGPLTIVVPSSAGIPKEVTGGGDSIAIRSPSHPVARALLAALGESIVAPSANRYQSLSPTRAEHVTSSLDTSDVLVLDAGACPGGLESTVVDARGPHLVILRMGGVPPNAIERIDRNVTIANVTASRDAMRASPGMDARHYAPRARLVLCDSREACMREAASLRASGKRVSVVVFGASEPDVHALPLDPSAAAQLYYDTLFRLEQGSDVIVVEAPPHEAGWEAIRDRLVRASTSV